MRNQVPSLCFLCRIVRQGLGSLALLLCALGTTFAQSLPCGDTESPAISLTKERFSVLVGAFAQLQYAATVTGTEVAKSDFSVPRVRLCTSGHVVAKQLRYRLMIGRSGQREIEVNDVYLEWQPLVGLALRLGRMKLPIIREWIDSARSFATVDRSLASRLLLPGRDYGVRISGLLLHRHVEYQLGIWNGEGDAATHAADTSPAVVARLALHSTGGPFLGAVSFVDGSPVVSLEGGLMWNRWKPPSSAVAVTVEDLLLNASVALRWAFFDGAAEYISQRRTDAEQTSWTHAGYLRMTYFVPRLHSAFTARASVVLQQSAKPEQQAEAEANWGLLLDQHRLKLVLRYGVLQNLLRDTTEHQLGLQAQVAVY